jgi:hypothetical protein
MGFIARGGYGGFIEGWLVVWTLFSGGSLGFLTREVGVAVHVVG